MKYSRWGQAKLPAPTFTNKSAKPSWDDAARMSETSLCGSSSNRHTVMNISINGYKVLECGSVVTHADNSVLFEVEGLNIKFTFKTDKEVEGLPIKLLATDNKNVEIELTNFNSIASGIEKPLKIGRLNEKSLYIQFMVTSLNETGAKILYYTFLLKME